MEATWPDGQAAAPVVKGGRGGGAAGTPGGAARAGRGAIVGMRPAATGRGIGGAVGIMDPPAATEVGGCAAVCAAEEEGVAAGAKGGGCSVPFCFSIIFANCSAGEGYFGITNSRRDGYLGGT